VPRLAGAARRPLGGILLAAAYAALQRLGRAGAAHGSDAGLPSACCASARATGPGRWCGCSPAPRWWRIDPWALTQAGFWLSFVAVGVLFASGPARARPRRSRARAARRGSRRCGAGARAVGGDVALTPLSLLLFGQVSLVGLLANLVAIPWVTLVVTPLGLAACVLPAVDAGRRARGLLARCCACWRSCRFATWSAPAPPLWAGAAGVLGGCCWPRASRRPCACSACR
jgi:competence protein ComEC